MKSFNNKTLIFTLVCAVLFGIYYYNNYSAPKNVRVHYKNQIRNSSKKIAMPKSDRLEKAVKISETDQAKERDDYNRGEFNRLMEELNSSERKLKKRKKICNSTLNEILPTDDYIDLNDEMYDEVTSILEAFTTVVNGAMFRPEAMKAYSLISTLVEEEYPIDPLIIYNRLERLDICRDPKALNFIDSVLESYKQKKWPINVRNNLINEVFNLLESSVAGNKSIENLLYFNNIALIMADNGLIPKSYSEELEDLGRRMNENHNLFKERFGPRMTRETNLVSLGDYLRRNEEYSASLLQHVSDIQDQIDIK
jgi:hypothetical protein